MCQFDFRWHPSPTGGSFAPSGRFRRARATPAEGRRLLARGRPSREPWGEEAPTNEKGRRANPAALPLRLELAYLTSTMLFSAFTVLPAAVML